MEGRSRPKSFDAQRKGARLPTAETRQIRSSERLGRAFHFIRTSKCSRPLTRPLGRAQRRVPRRSAADRESPAGVAARVSQRDRVDEVTVVSARVRDFEACGGSFVPPSGLSSAGWHGARGPLMHTTLAVPNWCAGRFPPRLRSSTVAASHVRADRSGHQCLACRPSLPTWSIVSAPRSTRQPSNRHGSLSSTGVLEEPVALGS